MASLTHKKKHVKKRINEFVIRLEAEQQEYAEVIIAKGSGRFEVKLIKNNEIINVKMRGALTKGPLKQRIEKKDIVLLHPDTSTTENNKFYIIHKYSNDDIKRLQKMGELQQFDMDTDKVIVIYEDDVLQKKIENIKIDDNFIDNI